MDLRDYPRPKGDTGIGVHWNAGFPAAVGIGQIRDVWLPELFALGVKWVKISRHDGGLELAELLLKHDILPIVRIYRPQPNPGVLDDAARAFVKDYVAAGVRYFEFNNEPDLTVEWQNGYLPPDAAQVVARNAIVDMEAILKLGGYPGLPALAVGCKWDLAGEICKLGRRDLLGEPVWQALHNYSINHPLDYPGDAGNQTCAAYTQEFYDRLATEAWDGQAWEGWSLDRINAERRDNSNPGATAFDDPSCWRAYERYDRLIRDQIGRSLPILATENGYIVAERPDPRYPATTPQLHAAQTLEACRIMMGTSSRFDHAPDYYFCTAFWLLGNYTLGHWAQEWEGQAWYSDRWPNGQLPIVAALKAEPKQARPWRGDSGLGGRVAGTAQGGAGLTVRLSRADGWSLTGRIAADGRFEFADVPLDSYRVTVIEAARDLAVTLTRERPAATANFDLTGIVFNLVNGSIAGKVRGGAGMTVGLARTPPLAPPPSRRGGGGGGPGPAANDCRRRQLSLYRPAGRNLRAGADRHGRRARRHRRGWSQRGHGGPGRARLGVGSPGRRRESRLRRGALPSDRPPPPSGRGGRGGGSAALDRRLAGDDPTHRFQAGIRAGRVRIRAVRRGGLFDSARRHRGCGPGDGGRQPHPVGEFCQDDRRGRPRQHGGGPRAQRRGPHPDLARSARRANDSRRR